MSILQNSLPIAASELIINERGAVYHLDLRPEELANIVITVGDPDRVERVSNHFDVIEHRGRHREFITHTGIYRGTRMTVLSSGIGPDNIDIVMNELDALVNIDLNTRMVKSELRSIDIIRIGTCGSLQADVPVDSFVASTHGLGIDNLLHFYRPEQNEEERQILHAFVTQTQLHNHLSRPYISMGSPSLLKKFTRDFVHGITVTCPGFYGPQGRVLRLGLAHPGLNQMLTDFNFGHHRITNFEMETSAIYGLGKLLGHHTLSLNTVVANRVSRTFSSDGQAAVDKLIIRALDILSGQE
jgi:uridine phosphorylase